MEWISFWGADHSEDRVAESVLKGVSRAVRSESRALAVVDGAGMLFRFHRVFACIEPAIRLAFPTSIESAFA